MHNFSLAKKPARKMLSRIPSDVLLHVLSGYLTFGETVKACGARRREELGGVVPVDDGGDCGLLASQ